MKTIAYLTLTGLALVQGAQIRGKAGAMVHDPVPPRCTGEVTLNGIPFARTRRLQQHKIGKGKYNKKALQEMGQRKNDVSSLKVPDNCQVIFYKGENFNGKRVKFEGPGAYDCRGKDVSSLKVTNSAAYKKAQETKQKATKAAKFAAELGNLEPESDSYWSYISLHRNKNYFKDGYRIYSLDNHFLRKSFLRK